MGVTTLRRSPVRPQPNGHGAVPSLEPSRWQQFLSPRVLLIGAVLITINALFVRAVQDPDFWWHVRIGRWIVENTALPSHDLFTYAVTNHVWTDHEYLTEALMWLLYSRWGMAPIIIGFAAITWLGFWLIFRSARGSRQPYVVVGILLAIGALAGAPIWGPRAQMITFTL